MTSLAKSPTQFIAEYDTNNETDVKNSNFEVKIEYDNSKCQTTATHFQVFNK